MIFLIFLIGVVPTIFWVFFWLRENRFKPEPPKLIILTFLAGACAVFLILPFEYLLNAFSIKGTERIFLFAGVEEIIKFLVVFLVNFKSIYLDKPIDYAIYLITGALGFATVENVFFLLRPDIRNNISFVIETGFFRFLGASILHSVLAAILGIIIGFVFYKSTKTKILFGCIGMSIVIILHTLFNFFIIKYVEIDGLLTLGILWIITLFIIVMFERVRRINH